MRRASRRRRSRPTLSGCPTGSSCGSARSSLSLPRSCAITLRPHARCEAAAPLGVTDSIAHMARLHREKMRWLLGEIVSGEYEPEELLPPEVVLAERLGVSRGVVREGMRALEERGV